tara:strand:- start:31930 stop:32868 length:939 start_codon:yes stop_codon:yes gene_type:complete
MSIIGSTRIFFNLFKGGNGMRGLLKKSKRSITAVKVKEIGYTKRYKRRTMESVTMDINPKMAVEMLSTMVGNRTLTDSHVLKLANAMKDSEWMTNGETIKFNIDGRVFDGQHRLRGIIQSGKTIRTVVVMGLPRQCFKTAGVDQKKRSAADNLKIENVKNASAIASALRLLYMYDKNENMTDNAFERPSSLKISNSISLYPGIQENLSFAVKCKETLPASIGTFLHLIFSLSDSEKADRFFSLLGAGTNLSVGNPIYSLREKCIAIRTKSGIRVTQRDTIAWTIKAWNAYKNNYKLHKIGWNRTTEKFPQIS